MPSFLILWLAIIGCNLTLIQVSVASLISLERTCPVLCDWGNTDPVAVEWTKGLKNTLKTSLAEAKSAGNATAEYSGYFYQLLNLCPLCWGVDVWRKLAGYRSLRTDFRHRCTEINSCHFYDVSLLGLAGTGRLGGRDETCHQEEPDSRAEIRGGAEGEIKHKETEVKNKTQNRNKK